MRNIKKLLFVVPFGLIALFNASGQTFTSYVNPFIGTGSFDEHSLSGNCYPGATVPFGMVQPGPDTRQAPSFGDDGNGYYYADNVMYGFSHTRLSGTGVSDFIDILLMPTTNKSEWVPVSSFSHDDEEAHPGYYRVKLQTYGIDAELSATTRCGIHHYTFPSGADQRLTLDLDHSSIKGRWGRTVINSQIRVISPTVIEGFRTITGWAKLRNIYFHIELSKPIVAHELMDGDFAVYDAPVINGEELHGVFDFDSNSANDLTVKLAISPVSIENARENMAAEAQSWDFDSYRSSADKEWDKYLGRIEVEGTDRDKTIFYTAMYHTMVQPNTMSDVNGEYMATDYSIRKMPEGKTFYSTFSLWDTYRAAHPLYNLIVPEKNEEFAESLLLHHESYGHLPVWVLWGQENYCMIGNHSLPVLVDLAMKNIGNIDKKRILDACVESVTHTHLNFPSEVWEKYGYMPENLQSQSVSITLEESFDDWCVAQLAQSLGEKDIYERFAARSRYYEALFNPEHGFFQAKNDKGEWIEPFDPLKYGANGGNPYTEGNPWQWLWYVPHDVDRLISLLGGNKAFVKKLDDFFSITDTSGEKNVNASGFVGQYVQGNEPGHHAAYLYNYAGEPRKTQKMVHHIIEEFYNTQSTGYAGNDDCGEMSAWYIFSSMGFYPVNPASDEYAISSPVFSNVKIHLANGKTFTIEAPKKDKSEIYIKKQSIDGKPYNSNILKYETIMNGSTLQFKLSSK